jgi:iron complex outermembrane receptor protein
MTRFPRDASRVPAASGLRRKRLAVAVTGAMTAGSLAAPALAELRLEEVVVTATKREESVMDVPLAITALSGEFTQSANLNDVKDLVSFTPGVSGNSQDSFIDAISVRGIRTQDFGVGGDPSAAFFKNDLYEGRNGVVVTSLYDMERSEVLRGPQGFLFGRNSIGGAFSVHTRKAEIGSNDGFIELDVAERGRFVTEGAVNLPVNDQFAMRLAGYYSTEDGFVDNRFDGNDLIAHDKWALRWSGTFETEALTVNTFVEYEDREQSGSVYRAITQGDIWDTLTAALGPINVRGDRRDADVDRTTGDADDSTIFTFGMRVDYDLGWAMLTSNTGYKDHDYFYTEDYDGTPVVLSDYQQDQTGDYFQQELRLTSQADGPLSWYAGASYYKEEIDANFLSQNGEDALCQYYGYYYYAINFTGCTDLYDYYGYAFTPSPNGLHTETGRIVGEYSGWAAYVDLSYQVTERLEASLGLRYTEDEKDFATSVPTPAGDLGAYWFWGFSTDGFIRDKKSWDELTSRALLRYHLSDDAMVYASYTEGYKAGGFGSFNLADNPAGEAALGNTEITPADGFTPNAFDPETVESWEFGYKNELFDGLAQLSLNAFLFEYQGLQVVTFSELSGASIVRNVGEVDGQGIEGTLNAVLSDYLDLYLGLSYLDTEAREIQDICGLDDPNGCEGRKLFWAPDWTGAAVLNFNYPLQGGELVASLEASYESERGGGWENLEETKIDAYTELALRVGYESADAWSVTAYVENLTDEFTWDGMNNNGGVVPSHFFGPRRPQTFGIRFGYEFE